MTDLSEHEDHEAEARIRSVLADLAAAPSGAAEAQAWAAIRPRLGAAPDPRPHRLRVAAVAALATAAAVGAGFVLLADDESADTVELGPAAQGSGAEPTTSAGTAPLEIPGRPLAVVSQVEDRARLDLYDADSGRLVARGLAESAHSISDVSVGPDGSVYFTEELGDSTIARAVSWDGSRETATPFDGGEGTRAPAVSPDGRSLAFVRLDPGREREDIVLLDLEDGSRTTLTWPGVDRPGSRISSLDWSPDSRRLVFVTSDGGTEVRVVEADADGLGASQEVTALVASEVRWYDAERLIGLHRCCPPGFTAESELRLVAVEAEGLTRTPIDGLATFDVDAAGAVVGVRHDGTVLLMSSDGDVRDLEVEGSALDVGL